MVDRVLCSDEQERRLQEVEASERRMRSRLVVALAMAVLAAGAAGIAAVNASRAKRQQAVALSRR